MTSLKDIGDCLKSAASTASTAAYDAASYIGYEAQEFAKYHNNDPVAMVTAIRDKLGVGVTTLNLISATLNLHTNNLVLLQNAYNALVTLQSLSVEIQKIIYGNEQTAHNSDTKETVDAEQPKKD